MRTIDEDKTEQIINKAGRSTYPDEKSVLRTEATRNIQSTDPSVRTVVLCTGMRSPTFQPYSFAIALPTITPSRVRRIVAN
jgi:hypothetical protein